MVSPALAAAAGEALMTGLPEGTKLVVSGVSRVREWVMRPPVRRAFALAGALIGWGVLVLVLYLPHSLRVTDVQILEPRAPDEVDMPVDWPEATTVFRVSAKVHFGPPQLAAVTLLADDCVLSIELDRTPIYASAACEPCKHCSFTRFPIPRELAHGVPTLTVTGKNLGGPSSFEIAETRNMPGWAFALLGVLGGAILWTVHLARLPLGAFFPPLAAGLLGLTYFEATSWITRSHDPAQHLYYLQALVQTHKLPPLGAWESHQPPVYYVLCALLKTALRRWLPEHTGFQMLSLICFLGAAALGSWLWGRVHTTFASQRWASWAGLFCFLFLPAHVFLAARLNNDAILPIIGVVLIGLCWRYSERPSRARALALGFAGAIALGCKLFAGGLVLAATCTVAFEAWLGRTGKREAAASLACVLVPPALVVALWWGRGISLGGGLLPLSGELPPELLVPNTAAKYLSFHYIDYLSREKLDTFDGTLRESFPTALLVTFLSGEYQLPTSRFTLTLTRFFFLAVVLAWILGVVRGHRSVPRVWLPCAVASVASLGLLTLFQLVRPYACNQDARYLSASFFPFAIVVSIGFASIEHAWPRLARYIVKPSLLALAVLVAWLWLTIVG